MPQIVKRTTVTEEYLDATDELDLDDGDEIEPDDEEVEVEPPRARRTSSRR